MDEVRQRVRSDIERFGWHVGKIPGDDRAPPWTFTIGLRESFGHPELIVFGLDLETGHRLLNQIGLAIKQGTRFEDGVRSAGILENHDVGFRSVEPRWQPVFAGNVAWYYEDTDVPILQCFWPDPTGRLPWDAGFDDDLSPLQPRLYEAEAERALSRDFEALLREEGALE